MTQEAAPTAPEWTWLARIRRTQGRKGEVLAEILTDFPEKFAERRSLALLKPDGTPLRSVQLINHWLHKGQIVLHFDGVDSITGAEELMGLIVAIPAADRAKLADGEVYIGDLIGCALIDCASGSESLIGYLTGVDRSSGPVPLLIVAPQAANAAEILIPFARAYINEIDLANHRLLMNLPEGLAELS